MFVSKSFRQFLFASLLNQGGFIKPIIPQRLMAPEGGDGGEGGAGGDGGDGGDGDKSDPNKPDKDGKYPKEFVEKLLREKNNFKTKAQDLEKQLKEKSNKPDPKEDKDEDKHKALLKAKDEEAKALKDELDSIKSERTNAMKLGTLKQEFMKNGGTEKTFELVSRLADTEKILIDEDSQVVYGAEAEIKRIKDLAPQLFGKQKVGTNDGDLDQNNAHDGSDVDKKKAIEKVNASRLRADKEGKGGGKSALVDFWASQGMLKK